MKAYVGRWLYLQSFLTVALCVSVKLHAPTSLPPVKEPPGLPRIRGWVRRNPILTILRTNVTFQQWNNDFSVNQVSPKRHTVKYVHIALWILTVQYFARADTWITWRYVVIWVCSDEIAANSLIHYAIYVPLKFTRLERQNEKRKGNRINTSNNCI